MTSAALAESSAVRPARAGRQAAILSARSATSRPASWVHVSCFASRFRRFLNSAPLTSVEVPMAVFTRRLRSSVFRIRLNQRTAASASCSAAQFTGRATTAGPRAPTANQWTSAADDPAASAPAFLGMTMRRSRELRKSPRAHDPPKDQPAGIPGLGRAGNMTGMAGCRHMLTHTLS